MAWPASNLEKKQKTPNELKIYVRRQKVKELAALMNSTFNHNKKRQYQQAQHEINRLTTRKIEDLYDRIRVLEHLLR